MIKLVYESKKTLKKSEDLIRLENKYKSVVM